MHYKHCKYIWYHRFGHYNVRLVVRFKTCHYWWWVKINDAKRLDNEGGTISTNLWMYDYIMGEKFVDLFSLIINIFSGICIHSDISYFKIDITKTWCKSKNKPIHWYHSIQQIHKTMPFLYNVHLIIQISVHLYMCNLFILK